MPGRARLGDSVSGTCYSHKSAQSVTGTINSASSDIKINNILVARKGDTVALSCGHGGVITGSSPDVKSNNQLVARLGDAVSGATGVNFVGSITSASEDVIAN